MYAFEYNKNIPITYSFNRNDIYHLDILAYFITRRREKWVILYKDAATFTTPTWVLSAPDGPHVGPMNLAIRVVTRTANIITYLHIQTGPQRGIPTWDQSSQLGSIPTLHPTWPRFRTDGQLVTTEWQTEYKWEKRICAGNYGDSFFISKHRLGTDN